MMYHKNPPVYACAVCGKETPADMLYGYNGDDVCSDCLEMLANGRTRARMNELFDNARIEQCKEGWEVQRCG